MKTIGRIDKVDFPELELENIAIKVDTGAYTTSIHCHHVKEIEKDGIKHLEFKLLDHTYPQYQKKIMRVDEYKRKVVRSSFGNAEDRFIIKTNILIFGKKYRINLSLSQRGEMRYPILLGRKFLNKKFIVDTSQRNLSFQLKAEKKNK